MSYRYQATVKEVTDGDTAIFDINLATFSRLAPDAITETTFDLGFNVNVSADLAGRIAAGDESIWICNESIRLYGINAPEKKKSQGAGEAARDYLQSRLPSIIVLETFKVKKKTKRDKYGRYLGIIWLPDGVNLNEELVEKGYAVPFMI